MQKPVHLFFILFSLFSFSQQTIVELEKTAYSEFKLDGILSEEELKNTKIKTKVNSLCFFILFILL